MTDCSCSHKSLVRAHLADIAATPLADLRQAIESALSKLLSQRRQREEASAPGHLFFGGPIHTLSDDLPTAEALLIQGEQITAVGALADVRAKAPPGTVEHDLKGSTMLPGFIDPHMHLVGSAAELSMIDLAPQPNVAYTPAYVAKVIRDAVARAATDAPVLFRGFDASQLTEWVNPTTDWFASLLGEDDSKHPIIIQSGSGHIAYANRTAITDAGINVGDPPKLSGSKVATYYEGPQKGQASGVFLETPAQRLIEKAMSADKKDPPSDPLLHLVEKLLRLSEGMIDILDTATRSGTTMLNEAALGLVAGPAVEHLIIELFLAWLGHPIRMASAMFINEWDLESAMQEITSHEPDLTNPRFLRQAIKLFADGSNQGATGLQRQPYTQWALTRTKQAYVGEDVRGITDSPASDLRQMIGAANEKGFQVMVHANGDAAIDNAIEAYSKAAVSERHPDLRNRIEHCSILHDDQIGRMKELDLTPTFLIEHVRVWGQVLGEMLGDERVELLDRCKSAYEAFGVFSLHSDYPVSSLKPLQRIQDAVTRVVEATGKPLNPGECVSIDLALKAQTRFAAWQCRADHLVGTLEVGKMADMVILKQDPYVVAAKDPQQIASIEVEQTWASGNPVYGQASSL